MRMEEQDLMLRVQSGDEVAFEEIVKKFKDKIVNFLWQITGDYQKAVELSQETFMRVYFKAGKYKPIAPVSSWIYAIASNLAKTDLKRSRRYSHVSLDDIVNAVPRNMPFNEDPANSDLIKNLRDAIGRLHPRYRVPLILKDIEGFSQEEIAEIMEKPLGTIKARISRGRQYLKRDLEGNSIKMELCEE